MGVDSGLPDFRGATGFWNAYPPYARMGLRFEQLANPVWFERDPALAWGFYGHRRNLYRATVPHEGFAILRRWAARARRGAFVFTSNVDGQFQRAGCADERIVEVHGAIDWMQCTRGCGVGIFAAGGDRVAVDEETLRAGEPFPSCPSCGNLARPNVLMFGDGDWDESRFEGQRGHMERWFAGLGDANVTVVECGAGTAVPTVRAFSERVARLARGTLVRINVREPDVPRGGVGMAAGALEALRAIDDADEFGKSKS